MSACFYFGLLCVHHAIDGGDIRRRDCHVEKWDVRDLATVVTFKRPLVEKCILNDVEIDSLTATRSNFYIVDPQDLDQISLVFIVRQKGLIPRIVLRDSSPASHTLDSKNCR